MQPHFERRSYSGDLPFVEGTPSEDITGSAILQAVFPEESTTNVFAILDGARVVNLPDMLAISGLEHACLFQGKAEENLSEVAPWIVRLETEASFTHALFTASDAPWHLWGTSGVVFIRSHLPLKRVRAHLRKFTRVEDDDGKGFYFRFWEPAYLRAYLTQMPHRDALKLAPSDKIADVLLPDGDMLEVLRILPHPEHALPGPIRLTPALRAVFAAVALAEFDLELRTEFCGQGTLSGADFNAWMQGFRSSGFKSRAVLRNLMAWSTQLGADVTQQAWALKELKNSEKYADLIRYTRLVNTAREADIYAPG